jgi:hypothetical protein
MAGRLKDVLAMTGLKSVIDRQRVPLSGTEIHDVLQMSGGFHDALLDTSRLVADVWIVELRHVYFPGERCYDAFGTDGCDLHFSGCNVPEETVCEAQDREIFELRLAGDRASIVFSFDGMEISGITFDPEQSFLQWRIRHA